ncbi:hypothetical protein NBRC10512v2_002020 [Rhodotorula toruloides]
MPVDSASLEAKIRESWPDATHVQVFDVSEFGTCRWLRCRPSFPPLTGRPLANLASLLLPPPVVLRRLRQSYEVIIVSPSFAGKTTLKKHREVNDKLKDEIAQLHAFTQKTFTPEQFENVKIVTQ